MTHNERLSYVSKKTIGVPDTEEDTIATQRKDKLGQRRKWRAARHFQSNSIDQNNFLLISKRLNVSPASVCSKVDTAGGKSLSSSSSIKTPWETFIYWHFCHTCNSRMGYWWPLNYTLKTGFCVTGATNDFLAHAGTHHQFSQCGKGGGRGGEGLGAGFCKECLALCELAACRRAPLSTHRWTAQVFCCCS